MSNPKPVPGKTCACTNCDYSCRRGTHVSDDGRRKHRYTPPSVARERLAVIKAMLEP